MNRLFLSTTFKAPLMRFNGLLLCELGLSGHVGKDEGKLWCFTDALYPIIFLLGEGRMAKMG